MGDVCCACQCKDREEAEEGDARVEGGVRLLAGGAWMGACEVLQIGWDS